MIRVLIRQAPAPAGSRYATRAEGGPPPERFFVVLTGVPDRLGTVEIVVSPRVSREVAAELGRKIEDEMDAYRRPRRTEGRRKPKTSWERINRG